MPQLTSALGYVVFLFLAWLMSSHKRRFPWRIVLVGSTLQFLIAVLILKTSGGVYFFSGVNALFEKLLECSSAGAEMLFKGTSINLTGDFLFAFRVLPTVIVFSSLMAVLYYLRVMQPIVRGMAFVTQRLMGASGAETLSACANIFMGQTEAPLVIRPYLPRLTLSELNSVMVCGFATISGSLIAAFSGMNVPAADLVTASVISCPAGLLIAKILLPELDTPETRGGAALNLKVEGSNLLEAAAIGASDGVKLALNIGGMLIAFVALLAMADYCLASGGNLLGYAIGRDVGEWKLRNLLGYCGYPFAWLMGIRSEDCYVAGQILGLKTAANEVIAYKELSDGIASGAIVMEDRSKHILWFALCGFSNLASVGIQIAGLSGIAPERRADLAKLAFRAMLGGSLACFLTACVVGIVGGPSALTERDDATRTEDLQAPAAAFDAPSAQRFPVKACGKSPANLSCKTISPRALAIITIRSSPNSLSDWRQAPQGDPPSAVTTAIATKRRWPADTADVNAERSAQIVSPYEAFSTLHPEKIAPSSVRSVAPT